MRKQNSTNTIHQENILELCGTAYVITLLSGRWKPMIIWKLLEGKSRYSDIKKILPGISERMLTLHLRQLEKDGLIRREVFPQIPPRVEYELTTLGQSLRPVFESMTQWRDLHQTTTPVKR